MGYYSDVVLAFAFRTKEQVDEVLAIYQMDEKVKEYDLLGDWVKHDWGDKWGLTYGVESSKWYESYEDVQAYEHMYKVVHDFYEHRAEEFPYAYRKIRIGEDDHDVEHVVHVGDLSDDLLDELYDRVNILREITTNF